jgi:hypothetical protein
MDAVLTIVIAHIKENCFADKSLGYTYRRQTNLAGKVRELNLTQQLLPEN